MSPELAGPCLSTNPKAYIADDVNNVNDPADAMGCCHSRSARYWLVRSLPRLPTTLHEVSYSNTGTAESSCDKGMGNSHLYHTHGSLACSGFNSKTEWWDCNFENPTCRPIVAISQDGRHYFWEKNQTLTNFHNLGVDLYVSDHTRQIMRFKIWKIEYRDQ